MTQGNLAAWFALLGAGLLNDAGVWALVLPTAILQNDNVRLWRSWLRTSHDVVIWSVEGERWRELTVELFELRVKTREPKREDIRQLVYVTPKCGALVAYSGESLFQQHGDAC